MYLIECIRDVCITYQNTCVTCIYDSSVRFLKLEDQHCANVFNVN